MCDIQSSKGFFMFSHMEELCVLKCSTGIWLPLDLNFKYESSKVAGYSMTVCEILWWI